MKKFLIIVLVWLVALSFVGAQAIKEVVPSSVKVAALKGPTAMGMAKLITESENGAVVNGNTYEWTITAAPAEVTPLIVKGDVNIAAVPANLAAIIYNNTKGAVEVCAINTLGVLYICENGSTIGSVSDLKGKTIYASGKGSSPEFALNYILTQNGIDYEKDVDIQWKSEHAECVAALLNDSNACAILPQPFVTTAIMQNSSITIRLDLTEEWAKVSSQSQMITGVTIVRKDWKAENPEAFASFMASYKESTQFVNANNAEAAKMIGNIGIVPEAVALKALPLCQISCITGQEMKDGLTGYLEVLYNALPSSVGGALPGDDFYGL